jgi:MFS family permease
MTFLVRARLGTVCTFALAGMVCGVWVARTPALADTYALSAGGVGLVVLVWGLGAVVAMQGLRGVISRLGSRAVLRVAAPLMAVGLALVALAPNRAMLLVAVAVFGMAFGMTDIGMNAQGSAVERALRRPMLNGMHAGWCAGAISGGLLGALSAYAGLSFAQAILGGAIIALPATLALGHTYIPEPEAVVSGIGRTRLPFAVYVVGALAVGAFMLEGTIADWSGLFLNRELGSAESVAALGYPLFEAAMLAGRLVGDRLRSRLGVRRLLTYAGLATAAAVGAVMVAPGTPYALAAFGLSGLAVCTVIPTTISLAGAIAPGRSAGAVAQVSAMGYGGLILGPVVIGPLADASSLRAAFGVEVVLGLLIAAGARLVPLPRLRPVEPQTEDGDEVRLAA